MTAAHAPRWDAIEVSPESILNLQVDALVNPANRTLQGGGGLDGAIHRKAGPELRIACAELHPEGCETGDAKLTPGFNTCARYILHTVGPIYRDGSHGEAERLASCYTRCIERAADHGDIRTIAFPAISTGAYGYPWPAAARVSLQAAHKALQHYPGIERVTFAISPAPLFDIFRNTFDELRSR